MIVHQSQSRKRIYSSNKENNLRNTHQQNTSKVGGTSRHDSSDFLKSVLEHDRSKSRIKKNKNKKVRLTCSEILVMAKKRDISSALDNIPKGNKKTMRKKKKKR